MSENKMIYVTAAIIRKDNKILICRRGPGGNCSLLWEFPGGKQEPGETMEDCLIRECKEELGITIQIQDVFGQTTYQYPDRRIAFTFYNAQIQEGNPKAIVHQDIRWVTLEELSAYEFCPADIEIVDQLAKGYAHFDPDWNKHVKSKEE